MPAPFVIRAIRPADIHVAGQHKARHCDESGRGRDIIFAPFEDFDSDAWKSRYAERRRFASDEPGWERLWGCFDGGHMVGHVDLTGPREPSSLHRARLGIGVERDFRGRGLGRGLMQFAIAWALEEPTLEWLDLSVFAHNLPARALYAQLGFREIATTLDVFRVRGQSIDDVTMTLRLRPSGRDHRDP